MAMAASIKPGRFIAPSARVQPVWLGAKAGRCSFVVRAVDENVKVENDSGASAAAAAAPKRGQVSTWFDETYTSWPEIHRVLTERKMKSLEWQKAYEMLQAGEAVLIDVREAQDFEKIRAQVAINAPLFRLIQGNSFKANIRRLGHALITDFAGTERNPDFLSQAMNAVNGELEKPVVVMCDVGGTLKTIVERPGLKPKSYADPERRFGRASRSLRAVYELQEAGFSNVYHFTGGFNTWMHEDLPTDGEGY
ncbi:hypothetical protein MPTK1_6g02370 [Marchantia polymorpha subsp. ruderalis]|uniref:Rhodanese domain-containing protein n=2 Tax=Marchantia polymorpha TaxID=3197 RepID=A0AAF6BMQ4_MARPO|nr:hypothetical protein MARPO_0035s0022 [Marchantia polymorpha]BBN13288.1 hypothetical protein Mp_6g02370 [Marchantia polymorpha subsp. ruderalis]|eukprot:PTQ41214.1 hypothetical protein MARPO_0035s0022 [Marchantia polymorpha]